MMHDEAAVSAAIDETRKQPRDKALCRPCWYWTEKCHVLADACEHYRRELARLRDERGDDGEAVTEAWLRQFPNAWQEDHVLVGELAVDVLEAFPGTPPIIKEHHYGVNLPTRGHVRRLCQTLGITLDTAEGGENGSA